MRIAVLGAGRMGTAFGAPALERGHEVRYWGSDWLDLPALEALVAGQPHPDLEAPLSAPVEASTEIEEAVRDDAELVVLAVTSEGALWVSEEAARHAPEGVPVLVRLQRDSSSAAMEYYRSPSPFRRSSGEAVRWSASAVRPRRAT